MKTYEEGLADGIVKGIEISMKIVEREYDKFANQECPQCGEVYNPAEGECPCREVDEDISNLNRGER